MAWWELIRMPGESFAEAPPALTADQATARDAVQASVRKLAGEIGERNLRHYPELLAAADYIEQQFRQAGYTVERQTYQVRGLDCHNLQAQRPATAEQAGVVIVGAHYDSAPGTPGANDNASGVAAMLELARRFADRPARRTLRFVAFTNEEPPHFQTEAMGSHRYAERCRQRQEDIAAAISLETIGYYSDKPGSQQYPEAFAALYPSEGNFIGFVGNVASRDLVHQVVGTFRQHAKIPSQGAAVPGDIAGVGWSDHWSFWQEGYPALMVTDTALFRYPWYHHADDTPDKLSYDHIVRVVDGLEAVIAELAEAE